MGPWRYGVDVKATSWVFAMRGFDVREEVVAVGSSAVVVDGASVALWNVVDVSVLELLTRR